MARLAVWVFVIASLLVRPSPLPAAEPPKSPNILFILADDLGYGDLGCYGQKQVRTPNIDKLAAEGVRFTQCYAGCTVCAPSRCCLMTGKHTGHAEVRGNALVPLRPEDVTVAEVLQGAGYTTGLVGKWGLGEPGSTGVPNRKGFDYFFGYLNQVHAHNYYPDYLWRNQEKVPLEGNVVEKGVATKRAQYSHDLFTKEALAFVEKHRAKPFFLYLAYTIPHANNEAGKQGMEVPDDAPYSDKDWPQQQKNHAAMITRLDRDVGALLKRLKELELDENTIVFFTSDNGPHKEGGADPAFFHSSGPLRGIKRDLTEGGIRVPAMARWPGRIEAGRVSDHPWAFWDFLPTAAELAHAKTPKDGDGLSIVPELLGKNDGRKQATHEFLYWEFHEGGFVQAVRYGDWKYIRRPLAKDKPPELYNLKDDIGETKNVAAQNAEVVAKIETCLKGARTESANWPVKAAAPKLPVPESVVFESDIEYSNPDGQHLQLDMARPKEGAGPFPAILCIHGGGFRAGSRQGYDGLCIKLAEQGYVAVTASYRLAPKYPFPAAIHDVKAAVRWLRANAEKYHIDPERIGVTGGSAGGHLAQFLGVTADVKQFEGDGGNADKSSRVACVVNYYGPSDFTKSYGKSVDAAEVLPLFLGGNLEKERHKHIIASPLYWVTPNAAPTLCVHGTEDKYVAHEQAVWLIDRLKASDVEAELLTLDGAGHGFKGKDAETAEKALFAFFAKHLKKKS